MDREIDFNSREADYELTSQGMSEYNRYRDDDKLYVKFSYHPLQNEAKSLEEGRPIFEDKEFITIMIPGDKDNVIMREARPHDKQRFRRHYEAFKARNAQIMVGTPLDKWAYLTAGQVEELKFFNIFTVEQLVDLADVHAQKFMNINNLKRQAKAYLEAAKSEAPIAQLQAQLDERDARIASLEEALKDQMARIQALEDDDG
jgi:hypothetical protein